MKKIEKKSINMLERISIKITRWVGSVSSILVHTTLFIVSFALYFLGINIDKILLIVTTIVSLEAIYLAIFIQMSVNQNVLRLRKVAKDIDEIQEDVEEIQKDVDDIQENVEEIQEDVEEIEKDVDEIQEDVEEIQEETDEEKKEIKGDEILGRIEDTLSKLIEEVIELKKQSKENKK